MFLAKVIGSLWATKKQPQTTGLKFLIVSPVRFNQGLPAPAVPKKLVAAAGEACFGNRLKKEVIYEIHTLIMRRIPEFSSQKLREVLHHAGVSFNAAQITRFEDMLRGASEAVVVVDTLDAGLGDTVVVAYGKAARSAIGDPEMPIEAAVVAIVDEIEIPNTNLL